MLVLLIRALFVIFAVGLGWIHGAYFISVELPSWAGGAVGFAIAMCLIAGEQVFRRRFTRSLVAFLIGFAGGLALSLLAVATLSVLVHDPDSRETAQRLAMPMTVLITYLVVVLVVQNADRFRLIVPFVEFQSVVGEGPATIIDPEALADARLPGLAEAGLTGRLAVHRSALTLWETRLHDPEVQVQARARRALTQIAAWRDGPKPLVEVDETELPGMNDASDAVVRLARLTGSRVLTLDGILADRCRAEGLRPFHLPALVAALTPTIKPGDVLTVLIAKVGDGRGQGVGFLDDGSMIVVGGAAEAVGQNVKAAVIRLHATANGRMIFAERAG